MDACVKAAALLGTEGRILEVAAVTEPGLPGLEQRGMPRHELGHRAERVWAAVTGSGLPWPRFKVTVDVTPSWLDAHDSALDLAVAVTVLAAGGTVQPHAAAGIMYYAGLAPDGALLPVPGVLPAAAEATEAGCRAMVVAAENAPEARLVPGLTVIGASRLAQVTGWLSGGPVPEVMDPEPGERSPAGELADIAGNYAALTAAEISAAGGHHLALSGSPGLTSRLALRVHGLLPALDEAAALEVTAVHSAAGALDAADPLVTVPPFQAPDPGCALAGMTGDREAGVFRPETASLAHQGVLFLDRAAEFDPEVLDALHGPAGTGTVFPPRTGPDRFSGQLPGRFILITASPPCECDWLPVPESCACAHRMRALPRGGLTGLLRDRASLRAVMAPPSPEHAIPSETRAVVAARVAATRERTAARLAGTPWRVNAEVPSDELLSRFMPGPAAYQPVCRAASLGLLTGPAAADVLRVAWTIADLNGHPSPTREDCEGALGFRMGAWR